MTQLYTHTVHTIHTDTNMDLVDEMHWEDVASERELFVSLESEGLEESSSQPIFGGINPMSNGIYAYTSWFSMLMQDLMLQDESHSRVITYGVSAV